MTTGAGNANNLHYELKRPAVETPGVNTAQPEEPRMASTSSRPPPSRAKRARSGNNTSELATTKADKRDAASNSTSTAKLTTTKRTSSGGTRRKPTNNPASTTQLTPPDEAEEGEEGEGEGEDGDGKRQQFLERNRIAALKCRQRKKKQLQELQDRHDYVIMENKRLHAEYMQLREQALQMRALLAAHRECPVAKANGVFGTDSLPLGMSSLSLQQPLLFTNGPESEHAKDIIAAIPPASNGVPVHAIDPVTGNPVNMLPH
ncbi:Transcription factor [Coemansia sp. RSA 1843]|nr:Transcription factor [Coemansia sp. RSA 1843]